MNRVRLERSAILDAALELADRDGLEGLTMRALGAQLGVEAPSLYKHVANKDAILDGIVEQIYTEVVDHLAEAVSDEPWQRRVHSYARALRQGMLDHPRVAPLLATRTLRGEASLLLVERALQELGTVIDDAQQQVAVLNIFAAFVMGHVLAQIAYEAEESDEIALRRAGLPASSFPRVRATLGAGLVDHELEFTLGLDVIIAGLEHGALPAGGGAH